MKIISKFPLKRIVYPGEIFLEEESVNALRFLEGDSFYILISSSVSENTDSIQKLTQLFKAKQILISLTPKGEAQLDNAHKYIAQLNQFNPDWIIAIGGGSCIDFAKLLWVIYENADITLDELQKPFFIKELRKKSRFCVLPTTAGTGSEFSSSSVFLHEGKRKFLVTHELLPDVVILDPKLLCSLPIKVKLDSLVDVLAHAIEGYVSPFASEMSKDMSTLALILVKNNFDEYLNENSLKSIHAIQRAASYAGLVQNAAIPGLGHALAHALSGWGVPHGFGCAVAILPSIRYNASKEVCGLAYDELARRSGLNGLSDLISFVENILSKYEERLPKHYLEELLSNSEMLMEMKKDPTFKANPVSIDIEVLRKYI
jgi:alcohol dehydrogenase class IV